MKRDEEHREEYDMCQEMRELLEDERAIGIKQGTKSIVVNMLKRGMSDEDICALAECTAGYVDSIRSEL